MESVNSTSTNHEMHGSLLEKSESRVGMISDRVWSVGKKIVITGMVVSSAPIVLPSLMVFSTLGFVFAIPLGFAFIGYACMEKVMRLLFPRLDTETGDYQLLDLLVVRGGDCEMKALDDKFFADEKRRERVGDAEEEEAVVEENNAKEGDENEKAQEEVDERIEYERDEGEVADVERGEKIEELKIDDDEEENVLDQKKEEKKTVLEYGAMVLAVSENGGHGGGFENGETVAEEKNLEECHEDEKTQVELEGKIEEKRDEEETGNVDGDKQGEMIIEEEEEDEEEEEEEDVVDQEKEETIVEDRTLVGAVFETGFENGETVAEQKNLEECDEDEKTRVEVERKIEEKRDEEEMGNVEGKKQGEMMIDEEEEDNAIDQDKEETIVEDRTVVVAVFEIGFENGETVAGEKNLEECDKDEKTQVEVEGKIEEKRDEEETGNVEGEKQEELIIDEEEEEDNVIVIDQEKEEMIVEDRTVVVAVFETGGQGQQRCFENGETVAEEKNVEEGDDGEKIQVDIEGKVEVKIDEEGVGHVGGREEQGEVKIDEEEDEEEEGNIVDWEKGENGTILEVRTVDVVLSEDGVGRHFENREIFAKEKNIEENDDDEKTQEVVKGEMEEGRDQVEVGNVEGGKKAEMKFDDEEEDNVVDQEKEVNGTIVEDRTMAMGVSDNGGEGRSFENGKNNVSVMEVTNERKCPWVCSNDVEEGEKAGEQLNLVLENNEEVKKASTPDSAYYSAQPVASVEHSVASVQSPLNSEFFSAIEEPCLVAVDTQSLDSMKQPVSSYGIEAKPKVFSEAEELYNEEKIWEQINAMRTIVGYKAALNASCMEELEALYVFTGIEPPVSSMDSPDLVVMNDNLQFLKSIVGVK